MRATINSPISICVTRLSVVGTAGSLNHAHQRVSVCRVAVFQVSQLAVLSVLAISIGTRIQPACGVQQPKLAYCGMMHNMRAQRVIHAAATVTHNVEAFRDAPGVLRPPRANHRLSLAWHARYWVVQTFATTVRLMADARGVTY